MNIETPTQAGSGTSKPVVSLVIPTMNEAKYIRHCIDSIAKQTFRDFEVIAVDASTDDTPVLCRQAGWQVIRQSGKGVSSARAEGFAAAKGSIIACTDADTAVDPCWLEHIARVFENDSVVCAYGPVYFMDGPPAYRFLGKTLFILFLNWNRLIRKDHVSGMNFAVRKTAYEAIGGFRTELWTAEDVDLGFRIRKQGNVIYDPRIKVYTSVRRLQAQGPLRFLSHHLANYFSLITSGRSSSDFQPIR